MGNDFIPTSELITNSDGSVYHLQLRPGELATTIITVGDPDRVDMITQHFDTIELTRRSREFVSVTGMFKGRRLSVISTGIGTDNIDIVINEVDSLFQVDFDTRKRIEKHTPLTFVRMGTSGAMQEDIAINSFVASEKALAFDRLLPFYSSNHFDVPTNWPEHLSAIKPLITHGTLELVQSIPNSFIKGITATMPGFYAPQGRSFRLPSIFKNKMAELVTYRMNGQRITNLEMETSGIYGLSHLLGHRAISLNAILANRVTGEFSTKPKEAIEELIDVSLNWLIQSV